MKKAKGGWKGGGGGRRRVGIRREGEVDGGAVLGGGRK